MPPKPKFTREEVINVASALVLEKGPDALTAQALSDSLGTSASPIFTLFSSMDEIRHGVQERALSIFRAYINRGLEKPAPFRGVGEEYIRFAREMPHFYRVLFIEKGLKWNGANEILNDTQLLVRKRIMEDYGMDANAADRFYRDLWLMAHGIATLCVAGICPYDDAQISAVLGEMSVAVGKAIKEIPGFAQGTFDWEGVYSALFPRQAEAI